MKALLRSTAALVLGALAAFSITQIVPQQKAKANEAPRLLAAEAKAICTPNGNGCGEACGAGAGNCCATRDPATDNCAAFAVHLAACSTCGGANDRGTCVGGDYCWADINRCCTPPGGACVQGLPPGNGCCGQGFVPNPPETCANSVCCIRANTTDIHCLQNSDCCSNNCNTSTGQCH